MSETWCENFGIPFGLPFKESMQEFMKHIHPEDRDRIKQIGLQLRRGEKIFMDEEFRINTGDSVKWMRYIAIVRKYSGDNDLQIIGLNQDITHIKSRKNGIKRFWKLYRISFLFSILISLSAIY